MGPLVVALLFASASCGDDDVDDAAATASSRAGEAADRLEGAGRSAASTIAETADEAAARGLAEALRLRLRDLADDRARWRDIELIRRAVDDLPGDVTVDGLTDANGDGRDDDGRLEVVVDRARACVRIESDDIDVSGGRCD